MWIKVYCDQNIVNEGHRYIIKFDFSNFKVPSVVEHFYAFMIF